MRKAVAIFESAGTPYALMHTTKLYPTPPHLVRLGAMTELMRAFPDAVAGLSDHTPATPAGCGPPPLAATPPSPPFPASHSPPALLLAELYSACLTTGLYVRRNQFMHTLT